MSEVLVPLTPQTYARHTQFWSDQLKQNCHMVQILCDQPLVQGLAEDAKRCDTDPTQQVQKMWTMLGNASLARSKQVPSTAWHALLQQMTEQQQYLQDKAKGIITQEEECVFWAKNVAQRIDALLMSLGPQEIEANFLLSKALRNVAGDLREVAHTIQSRYLNMEDEDSVQLVHKLCGLLKGTDKIFDDLHKRISPSLWSGILIPHNQRACREGMHVLHYLTKQTCA